MAMAEATELGRDLIEFCNWVEAAVSPRCHVPPSSQHLLTSRYWLARKDPWNHACFEAPGPDVCTFFLQGLIELNLGCNSMLERRGIDQSFSPPSHSCFRPKSTSVLFLRQRLEESLAKVKRHGSQHAP